MKIVFDTNIKEHDRQSHFYLHIYSDHMKCTHIKTTLRITYSIIWNLCRITCAEKSSVLMQVHYSGWTKQKCLQSTKTFLDQTYLIKSRSTSFCAAASVYQLYEHYTRETGFFKIIKFEIKKNNTYARVIKKLILICFH